MTIQHRMDGALGGDRDSGESAEEAFANLAGTPTRVFALHVENEILHLKRKLMRVAVGASASVGQPLHPTLLVAIEDLVAGLTGDAKLPAKICHRLPRQPASHQLRPLIPNPTLLSAHPLPPKK